jgi:HSP20 family protein
MYYRSLFPRDVFADLDRLQRAFQQSLDAGPDIRGLGRGFPAVNVGTTPTSVEVLAFAPGIDASTLDVQLDRGTLTISGERKAQPPAEKATIHIGERLTGRFRRVVSLPDDIDPASIEAHYREGVLQVSVKRLAQAQPRRITVQ